MEPTAPARAIAAVASGLLGASIGSFLNVVIYRVPRAMSIVRPPSHCPKCGTELGSAENVPLLSWLVLRGRCRHCGEPISPRYPIVELAGAGLFVAFSLVLSSFAPVASLDCLAAAALAAAMIAIDHLAVPRSVALFAVLGAATLALVSVTGHEDGRLPWAALGAAASAVGTGFVLWLAGRRRNPGEPDPARLPLTLGVVLASLGWGAGWLWRPGGFVVAAVSTALCGLSVARRGTFSTLPGAACLLGLAVLVLAGALGHA
ncbi:MAG TPA: prepilin peptidase [Acidimicrobiales bacterium]|nr:prepilin peptidase [Acidimicrobiales bacterium]